jgi:hypothetical protein
VAKMAQYSDSFDRIDAVAADIHACIKKHGHGGSSARF